MSLVIPAALVLNSEALGVIEKEVSAAPDTVETGGILLGRWNGKNLEILIAGGPGPKAVHQPRYFLRDLTYSQQLAASAWSEHRAQWIGEWHTHPHTGLAPSDFDLGTYRKHLHDDELGFGVFISVIARTTPSGVRFVAWAVTVADVERVPLQN